MKRNLKVLTNCDISSEILMDHLEGELDPSFAKDLDLHIAECEVCQKESNGLKKSRTLIQAQGQPKSDEFEMPSDEFFKNLENKIMTAVANVNADSGVQGSVHTAVTVVVTLSRRLKTVTLPLAATAALFLLVFGALYKSNVWKTSSQEGAQAKLEDQLIVQAASNDPGVLANSILNQQTDGDLELNAAAERLSRMSDQEARALIDEMR